MSQKMSEEPKGAVPQALADDFGALASEIRAIDRKASAAWKTALVVWIIFLAVEFSYLYFGVYRTMLKPYAEPGTIVSLGMQVVDGALAHQGLPPLDSAQLPQAVADRLKAAAPSVMQHQVKPQIERLLADLPRLRAQYTEKIKQEAPQLIEEGLGIIEDQVLPWANRRLLDFVSQQVDTLMANLDQQLSALVGQVIAENKENIAVLKDKEALRVGLEKAFEEAMGGVMDELFKDLDKRVADVRAGMQDLVLNYKSGNLTHVQALEVRLIQDVEALFRGAGEQPMEIGIPELQSLLDELSAIGVPEVAREEIRRAVPTGAMPDLSNVPEQYRERVKSEIERARKAAAEAAARGAAAAGKAASGAATVPGAPGALPADLPPEVREKIEQARKAGLEAAARGRKAAGAAAGGEMTPAAPEGVKTELMTPEAAKAMEEGKKKAEEAAKKAAEAAGR